MGKDARSRRFLFLTQTYPRRPGDTTGPFIRDLARGLVRAGDDVTVLTPHAKDVPATWDDDGVVVESFRYAPESLELVGYSRSLDKDERIKGGSALSAPLYMVGAWRAVRRCLARRPFDLVQAHWVVPNALVAVPAVGRLPLAVGLHGSDVFLAEKPVVRTMVGRALARTQVLTGCSPELVDRVCALGFPREKAHVIPYGVDSSLFAPDRGRRSLWRQKLNVSDSAPLLVSVGRMATKKGYQVLLERIDQLMEGQPDLHLVLAGGGDRQAEFQAAAQPWSDRIHFPGAVLRDTLPDLYRAADGFFLPAVHDPQGNVDGLPNVILEAMATGLPVVTTTVSGIPLAIEDGANGFLVPEQDAPALIGAIDRLLADPDRARAMGEEGRRRAVDHHHWDTIAGRYRAAYEQALNVI